jgi:hypothetical protein
MVTLALYYWHFHGGSLPVPLTPLSESAHTNHWGMLGKPTVFHFSNHQRVSTGARWFNIILMPSGDSTVPVELSSPCRMQHNADDSASMIINHVVVVFIYSLLFVVTAMELVYHCFLNCIPKHLRIHKKMYLCLVEWTAGYYTGCHQC